jgi:hypothetical protein
LALGAGFALPEAWDKCEWPYNHIILGKVKKFFAEHNEDILKVDSVVSWSHFLLKITNQKKRTPTFSMTSSTQEPQ